MLRVSAHQGVLIFRPREERRVVGNVHLYLVGDSVNGARPFGLPLRRKDARQSAGAVKHLVKISQRFDPRENALRKFAKERHKAAVPYPHLRGAKRLVHIRVLRHSVNALNVLEGEPPSRVIKIEVFGVFAVNGNGNFFAPIFCAKVFFHSLPHFDK